MLLTQGHKDCTGIKKCSNKGQREACLETLSELPPTFADPIPITLLSIYYLGLSYLFCYFLMYFVSSTGM